MKSLMLQIMKRAEAQHLPFLLVGGHAVILHGVPRFTRDIDFLTTDQFREDWHQLLQSCGYQLIHQTGAFDQFRSPAGARYSLPDFDLMLVDENTWQQLIGAAEQATLSEGISVPIPAILHLIAMKAKAAASPTRANKAQDISDIASLLKLAKLKVEDPEVQAIILQQGDSTVMEDVKKLNEQ